MRTPWADHSVYKAVKIWKWESSTGPRWKPGDTTLDSYPKLFPFQRVIYRTYNISFPILIFHTRWPAKMKSWLRTSQDSSTFWWLAKGGSGSLQKTLTWKPGLDLGQAASSSPSRRSPCVATRSHGKCIEFLHSQVIAQFSGRRRERPHLLIHWFLTYCWLQKGKLCQKERQKTPKIAMSES